MVRAVLGGAAVSLCAALLGVSLVLRRYSMIGDGLSHVSFGALSIAIALGWSPLKVSIPLVIIAAFFLLRITENGKVKSDAAIAVLSASSLAAGIVVTSLTTGMTTDISSYMFGSILAMSREDVFFSCLLSLVVFGMFVLFYNKMFNGGFSWRVNESLILLLGAKIGSFQVGYAYDFPISTIPILKATSGSHELVVSYKLKLKKSKSGKNRHKSVRIL